MYGCSVKVLDILKLAGGVRIVPSQGIAVRATGPIRAEFKAIWPHRAIIAIDNWFEWVYEGGPKKQPYLIRHHDQSPILCAAIGQYPIGEHEPGEHDGFVIITADSAGGMVDIHDRRPVTLSSELAREWLDPATPKECAEQMVLLQGEPTEAFEWFKVDRAVGNVRNHGPELIKPIADSLA
jgi:putative SOS response-associated peptidase YedK